MGIIKEFEVRKCLDKLGLLIAVSLLHIAEVHQHIINLPSGAFF